MGPRVRYTDIDSDSDTGSVVVVGSINLDRRIEVDALPRPGQTVLARRSAHGGGGKGANQAVAAAGVHDRVSIIGAVGNDDAGAGLLGELAGHGVDTSAVRRFDGYPTGTATVLVEASGANLIVVEPGANQALRAADLPAERIAAARVLLLQMEIDPVVSLAAARAARGCVIVNPAPVAAGVAELVSVADVLVPNEHELAQLAGRDLADLDDVVSAARSVVSAGDVVVTLGERGAMLWQRSTDEVEVFPAPTVRPVDTTGAGDVFCGVLGAAIARGCSLPEACARAVELASRSTTFAGARSATPR